jgi:hypothetical protein
MTFITHRFRVSVVSDVQERVQDLGLPLRFMLSRSSLVECASVLCGTGLQCAEKKYSHQYVKKKSYVHIFYYKELASLAFNSNNMKQARP